MPHWLDVNNLEPIVMMNHIVAQMLFWVISACATDLY